MRNGVIFSLLFSVVLCAWLGEGAVVRLSLGFSQVNVVWQTAPPAFRDASWALAGLDVLLGLVNIGSGIAVVDLRTFRFESPFSLCIYGCISVLNIQWLSFFGEIGLVLTPQIKWVGRYLGVGAAVHILKDIQGHVFFGYEVTDGAPGGYPAGRCSFVRFGMTTYVPLL